MYSDRPLSPNANTIFLGNGNLLGPWAKAIGGTYAGAAAYDGKMMFWVPRESRHV